MRFPGCELLHQTVQEADGLYAKAIPGNRREIALQTTTAAHLHARQL